MERWHKKFHSSICCCTSIFVNAILEESERVDTHIVCVSISYNSTLERCWRSVATHPSSNKRHHTPTKHNAHMTFALCTYGAGKYVHIGMSMHPCMSTVTRINVRIINCHSFGFDPERSDTVILTVCLPIVLPLNSNCWTRKNTYITPYISNVTFHTFLSLNTLRITSVIAVQNTRSI